MPDGHHEVQENRRNQDYMLDQVATAAVKKTLGILGVDIDIPKDVEEFRRDLRFSSDLRKAFDKAKITTVILILAAFVGLILSKFGWQQ